MALDVQALCKRGYFPKELPPLFDTTGYAAFVRAHLTAALPTTWTSPTRHNLARRGGLRRPLSIPQPRSFLALCQAVDRTWPHVATVFAKSKLLNTAPTTSPTGRYFEPDKVTFESQPFLRSKLRARARFRMFADISQCYSSIYTHAFPWAITSKAAAKAARRPARTSMPGALMDIATRNAQDGQTKGIPIGPDTSLALAELILCSVDAEFERRMRRPGPLPAMRMIDDLEYYAETQGEAEDALLNWELAASDMELQINPEKTVIDALPFPLQTPWRIALSQFRFATSPSHRRSDLVDFFSQAAELSRDQNDERAVSFAITRSKNSGFASDASTAPVLFDLILAAMATSPAAIRYGLPTIAEIAGVSAIDKTKLVDSLNSLAEYHATREHGAEVAWALHGIRVVGGTVDKCTAQRVSQMEDNLALLELVLMDHEGLVGADGVLYTLIVPRIHVPGAVCGSDWLLAYECTAQGWGPPTGADEDPFLRSMVGARVTFIDRAKATPGSLFKSKARPVRPSPYLAPSGYLLSRSGP